MAAEPVPAPPAVPLTPRERHRDATPSDGPTTYPDAPGPAKAPAPTTLSVVICAFTTARWAMLQSAVRSVLRQQPRPHETIVVIDHCAELEELAREALCPLGVRVLANEGARGLSGARNTGTYHAGGDVVVFLDDDACAHAGWLDAHARHYANPEVIGVGGHIDPGWQNDPPAWFPPEFGWVVGCSYVGQPGTISAVRNPIGANMSFRRSVILEAGGFSRALGRVGSVPVGCEETELSIRARATHPSGVILHDPGASVRHHVPGNRGTWEYFSHRCWSEGRSKARVGRLTSNGAALSVEGSYVRTTLAGAVRRNLAESWQERRIEPALRASAICMGLTMTTIGFAVGQLARLRHGLGERVRVP